MICYKDMTFCPFYDICRDGDKCHRALTDDVKTSANSCGLGVSQYSKHPTCYVPVKVTD